MKRIAWMLVFAMLFVWTPPSIGEALSINSRVENMDALTLELGEIYVCPSENEDTRDTHGWIVMDAGIINFAVKEVRIADMLSAQLVYQDKYIFDAQLDFGRERIQPLVELEGRLIFEVPLLVAETGPGSLDIFITVNREAYSFDIPFHVIESMTMKADGQVYDVFEPGPRILVAPDAQIEFEWSASEGTQDYRIKLNDWQFKPLQSKVINRNSWKLDASTLPAGDWYHFRVMPQPCFDLWQPESEGWCSFYVLEPTPEPTQAPTPEPSRTPDPNAAIDASSSRERIASMQEMLVKVGLMDSADVNGDYGETTIFAVIIFQNWVNEIRKEQTLSVTGVCDALTLLYLEYCIETGRVVELPTAQPDPTARPSVSAPAINIGSSVYQQDGVTYINDSNVIFRWMAEGQVESYTVNLVYEDGTSFSLGTVTDTSKSVPTQQLQPGLYKLYVGATPIGGGDEDTVWNEITFGIPAPEPDPIDPPAVQPDAPVISYIDASSSAGDIQTVQVALYQLGLLDTDSAQAGVLDEGTLSAVAAFQKKVNDAFGAELYVIDPVSDAFIDSATLDYLLYQEENG